MSDIVEKLYDTHVCSPAQNSCRNDSLMQLAAVTIHELRVENEKLRLALMPFAACADELEGSDDVARTPDDEWAKFRLLASDYRKAKSAMKR